MENQASLRGTGRSYIFQSLSDLDIVSPRPARGKPHAWLVWSAPSALFLPLTYSRTRSRASNRRSPGPWPWWLPSEVKGHPDTGISSKVKGHAEAFPALFAQAGGGVCSNTSTLKVSTPLPHTGAQRTYSWGEGGLNFRFLISGLALCLSFLACSDAQHRASSEVHCVSFLRCSLWDIQPQAPPL